MTTQPVRPLHAAVAMAVLLAGLWVVEGLDQLSGNALDTYGIHARELDGLPEIFTAPLLHAGWDHLASNSVPFFAFGALVLLGGVARWVAASLVSVVSSGLTAWLLTPAGTIVLGASGLIFGWLTYLLVRGIWSRRPGQVVLALAILFVYGGLLWGVLPTTAGVSWQAHLGGAVGGVVAAWLLHRRDVQRRPTAPATALYG
ncbi:rhomboid family intramembrane serine protease [Microlunatus antarcticus]|uniref:Membrane associated rhomboid family serine protease n=2 Tax=Microlunatus antarcticus TaxID=53388 RepID=A0A7W5P6N1_9ACTN|nr:rhomboid family intramembrane serine protease [Microlunatus antarcticus]MBB3326046.1 membrane associated rhomboid family serine protease [Microlunatus antarcticus]